MRIRAPAKNCDTSVPTTPPSNNSFPSAKTVMKQDCKCDHLELAVARHWHLHVGLSYKHPPVTVSTANFPAQTLHVIRRILTRPAITLSLKPSRHFSLYPKRILHTLPRTKAFVWRIGGQRAKKSERRMQKGMRNS